MEHRLLGASGFSVPVLCLGTATFGGASEQLKIWGQTQVDEATRMVDIALDAGVTLFDSADAYSTGLAEEILGKSIAGRRDKLLISTKSSFRMGPMANDIGSTRHHLVAACEASLKRLGTDYIDLWQMHAFDTLTPIEETLSTLDDLVRAGKVRYVGCSNFSGWHLMKSLAIAERYGWPRYIAHQAYYSLVGREFEWELMPLGLDQKVGTVVWSSARRRPSVRQGRPQQEGAGWQPCRRPGRDRSGLAGRGSLQDHRCAGRDRPGDRPLDLPGGAQLAAAPSDRGHHRGRCPQRSPAQGQYRRRCLHPDAGAGQAPR